jgi:hypothetical protein
MRFIPIKARVVLAVVSVMSATVAMSIAYASTTGIKPAGDRLLATSTDATFQIGAGAIDCALTQTAGTIATPESASMKLNGGDFENVTGAKECTSTGIGGATFTVETTQWELAALSETTASLSFPASDFIIRDKGHNCTLRSKGNTTLSASWRTGTGSWSELLVLAKPSVLTFGKASISLERGAGFEESCPAVLKEATSASFSATFIVNDITNLGQQVSI